MLRARSVAGCIGAGQKCSPLHKRAACCVGSNIASSASRLDVVAVLEKRPACRSSRSGSASPVSQLSVAMCQTSFTFDDLEPLVASQARAPRLQVVKVAIISRSSESVSKSNLQRSLKNPYAKLEPNKLFCVVLARKLRPICQNLTAGFKRST